MNSNGGSAPGNFSDHPRSNSNRYRGGLRRGRGRGNNERSGNIRFNNQKDRRSLQSWRDSGRHAVAEEPIDLGDSSQWPSIQESSVSGVRGRSSVGPVSERTVEQEINQDYAELHKDSHSQINENSETNDNRRSVGSQRAYSHTQSGSSQGYGYSQSGSNSYGNRQGGERYSGSTTNRGRGRYNNYANNRYQGGFNRRYSKGFVAGIPGNVVFHPEAAPFFCPQVFDPTPYYTETHPVSKNELGPQKQVEYYFSPSNLVRDTFIRSKMDKEGWVPLHEIYNFKRIQNMKLDFEEFVKKLSPSDYIEVDEVNYKIRTKLEPKKWVLGESSVPENQRNVVASSSDMGNAYPYSGNGGQGVQTGYQIPPYNYPVPVSYYGYGNFQSQYRSFHPYPTIYQPSPYGIQIGESLHDSSYQYPYGQDYYGSYQSYDQAAYVGMNSAETVAQDEENGSQVQKSDITKEPKAIDPVTTETTKEEALEELSQKMSNLDVSNPPVSC